MKNYQDWQRDFKKSSSTVMGFGGNERFFVEEAVLAVKKKFLKPGLESFNFDAFNAKQHSLSEVLTATNTLPVMADCRLVLVKDSDGFTADSAKTLKSYLKNPTQTTLLAFIFEKISLKSKFAKTLNEAGLLYDFEHPTDEEMLKLIKKRAKMHQLSCEEEVAWTLLMEVGSDLMLLERAFEKLALAKESGEITLKEVSEHISQTRAADAFRLARSVSLGQRKQAVLALSRLQAERAVPLRLVGLLTWQLRLVVKAKVGLLKGVDRFGLGRQLGLYGDRLKPVLEAASKRSLKMHQLRLSRMYHLDKMLKSTSVQPWLLLDRTVLQLCPAS